MRPDLWPWLLTTRSGSLSGTGPSRAGDCLLLVMREGLNRDHLERPLRREFPVLTAPSAELGIQLLDRPDVGSLVLDGTLCQTNAGGLRRFARLASGSIPLIVLIHGGDLNTMNDYLELGVDVCLPTSVSPSLLIAYLRSLQRRYAVRPHAS